MGVQLSKTSHQIIFLILIPILSICLVYVVGTLLQRYIPQPWILFIDSVGVLGMYTIIFRLFDNSIWQLFSSGIFQIVDVPNLNGTWVGELRSSYDDNKNPYEVRVEIIQTFSNIKVFAYFKQSWSYSIIASFHPEADKRQVLHYIYRNEPRNNAKPTMQGHYGAAKHEFIKDKESMECSYYNEPPRDRGWYGSFNVKRKKRSFFENIFPSLRKI